jgi:hypothetical protein
VDPEGTGGILAAQFSLKSKTGLNFSKSHLTVIVHHNLFQGCRKARKSKNRLDGSMYSHRDLIKEV